ncbi:hydroxyethylthiazole kinase [Dethiosulfatibacter aminovorans DSM 17477]|uniref:Hydroxyethylthiazole kinase n=1 Tax=Dethiosulfatibacter aminovorans DSM 17477 TaxID=1121476 RepID=A0A1M6GNH8_9FIRM|nr:hydroxyethylthiazole kinase [Dethiosulfatibacter aminovorans]SHJ11479.1 hydroxyethylthiazole kinase [Dethiosulfatibacter aminovorans DSM 17477]
MDKIIENLRNKPPLVHHITNYVTVNDCANVVLAAGGAPIMADDVKEVEEIVSISSVLYINIGTLNERTVESMVKAGKRANCLGLPVLLDPVGMGASRMRNDTVHRLMNEIYFTVIKGNMSEIKGLYKAERNTGGVDVKDEDIVGTENLAEAVEYVKKIAREFDSVVAVTGAIDIVTDGEQAVTVRNGHPNMSRVTGTGCMTGSVMATYVGSNPERPVDAVVAALVKMGLAGERAELEMKNKNEGISSYKRYLIDGIDLIGLEEMKEGGKIEYL